MRMARTASSPTCGSLEKMDTKSPGIALADEEQKGGVAKAEQKDELLSLQDALWLARPVVVAQDGPGAAG